MANTSFTLDDLSAILAQAGVKNVDDVLAQAAASVSVAAAEKVLSAKVVEGDVSDVRAFLFDVASRVSHQIETTAGDPNGGNKNTRADRHMLEIPTPHGRLQIHLYRD